MNYWQIINKYIPTESRTYHLYVPHVTLVTAKALKIARRLGLSRAQQQFIEEAAMLHDIGIIGVQGFSIDPRCTRPYLQHAPLGRELLEAEGWPQHALVAERHVGVGLTQADIRAQNLPLPVRDMVPETVEEAIISWADLFYTKHPDKLWEELSLATIERKVSQYGARPAQVFQEWRTRFEETT